jgi:hypothetical protein
MTEIRVETRLDDVYDLGEWIGRRQALATLAGACSAADAECLRQVRNGKKYRALGLNWEQFCHQRVGIDRGTAERIIRLLEEFGPRYFTLAQITGISAAEYRRLAPRIGEQGLSRDGQTLAITQENAPRLIEAVQELRRTVLAAPKPAAPAPPRSIAPALPKSIAPKPASLAEPEPESASEPAFAPERVPQSASEPAPEMEQPAASEPASAHEPVPAPEQPAAPKRYAQDSEGALTRGAELLARAVDELECARALGLSPEQTSRLLALVERELGRLSVVQLIHVTLPGR